MHERPQGACSDVETGACSILTRPAQMHAVISGQWLCVFATDGTSPPQAVECVLDLRCVPSGLVRRRPAPRRVRSSWRVLAGCASSRRRCRSPRLKVTSVTADQVIHAQRSDVPLIFRVEGGMGENDGARLFLAASVPEKVRHQGRKGVRAAPKSGSPDTCGCALVNHARTGQVDADARRGARARREARRHDGTVGGRLRRPHGWGC